MRVFKGHPLTYVTTWVFKSHPHNNVRFNKCHPVTVTMNKCHPHTKPTSKGVLISAVLHYILHNCKNILVCLDHKMLLIDPSELVDASYLITPRLGLIDFYIGYYWGGGGCVVS